MGCRSWAARCKSRRRRSLARDWNQRSERKGCRGEAGCKNKSAVGPVDYAHCMSSCATRRPTTHNIMRQEGTFLVIATLGLLLSWLRAMESVLVRDVVVVEDVALDVLHHYILEAGISKHRECLLPAPHRSQAGTSQSQ
jgi:hypothetical protein